jgi:hypothetical protein
MMPLEYICGCIGMGLSFCFTKTTSGGSDVAVSLCTAENVLRTYRLDRRS